MNENNHLLQMKSNKNYKRLVGSIYFLLSAFLVISLLGILFYTVLMIISTTKDVTAVPIDLPLAAEHSMKLLTNAGEQIIGKTSDLSVSLIITEAPNWFLIYAQVHFLGLFFIGLYGISQLWFIFRSMHRHLKSDYPFKLRYVMRIRQIALAFFIWSFWQLIFFFVTKYGVISQIAFEGRKVEIMFDMEIIISLLWGLIILVLAEIFRFGKKKKKDNELTV